MGRPEQEYTCQSTFTKRLQVQIKDLRMDIDQTHIKPRDQFRGDCYSLTRGQIGGNNER